LRPLAVAAVSLLAASSVCLVGPLVSAQADTSAACSPNSGFNQATASDAQLAACGIEKAPLTSVQNLPDGGKVYWYTQPDGQPIGFPQTPPNFNGTTATQAQQAAYGIPAAPSTLDIAATAKWNTMVSNWHLDPGDPPAIYSGPTKLAADDGIWDGYYNTAGGWTRAENIYLEPSIGPSVCSNDAFAIWSGLGGVGSDGDLGQTGTITGEGSWPNHSAFFETLPGSAWQLPANGNAMVVSAGDGLTSVTDWNGSEYIYTLTDGSTEGVAYAGGPYYSAGTTADEILERLSGDNLTNFGEVWLNGYNGQGQSPLANHATGEFVLTGYTTTSSLSGPAFSITQNNCAG
jgi:hypothetical protein